MKLPFKISVQGLRPPLAPHIPQEFAELMTRCWDNDAKKRPDMKQVVKMLLDFPKKSKLDYEIPVDVTSVGNSLYNLKEHAIRAASDLERDGPIVAGYD
jgi:hypothetical protein